MADHAESPSMPPTGMPRPVEMATANATPTTATMALTIAAILYGVAMDASRGAPCQRISSPKSESRMGLTVGPASGAAAWTESRTRRT